MSVAIKDPVTGKWVQTAGNGKAEYGASTFKTGYLNSENLTNGFEDVTVLDIEHPSVQYRVVFAYPMPDADYTVIVDVHNTNLQVEVASADKTANGFVVTVRNLIATMRGDRGETTDSFAYPLIDNYFNYTAFKLYTDTEYNSLLTLPDRVEALETKVNRLSNITLINSEEYTLTGLSGHVRVGNRRGFSTHTIPLLKLSLYSNGMKKAETNIYGFDDTGFYTAFDNSISKQSCDSDFASVILRDSYYIMSGYSDMNAPENGAGQLIFTIEEDTINVLAHGVTAGYIPYADVWYL